MKILDKLRGILGYYPEVAMEHCATCKKDTKHYRIVDRWFCIPCNHSSEEWKE